MPLQAIDVEESCVRGICLTANALDALVDYNSFVDELRIISDRL